MKVAVIGARGYIGRNLCQALAQRGIECFALSAGDSDGISLSTGLLPQAFTFQKDVDVVYYLAQSPYYRQLPEYSGHLISVNCVAATQAAEAARRAGVRKFIYASTANVYASSFSPLSETAPVRRDNWYSLSKLMAEEALALYRADLDVTCTRIFGAYGAGQDGKLVPTIAQAVFAGQEVFLAGNPHDPLDFDGLRISLIYIDDLVSALIKLAEITNCPTINLAGNDVISVRRLTMALGAASGRTPKLSQVAKAREEDYIADIDLCRAVLGEPNTDFASGIAKFMASFKFRESSVI